MEWSQGGDAGADANQTTRQDLQEAHDKEDEYTSAQVQLKLGEMKSQDPETSVRSPAAPAEGMLEAAPSAIPTTNTATLEDRRGHESTISLPASFVTAPDSHEQRHRTSVASSILQPGPSYVQSQGQLVRKDTMGSLSMARIAEATEEHTAPSALLNQSTSIPQYLCDGNSSSLANATVAGLSTSVNPHYTNPMSATISNSSSLGSKGSNNRPSRRLSGATVPDTDFFTDDPSGSPSAPSTSFASVSRKSSQAPQSSSASMSSSRVSAASALYPPMELTSSSPRILAKNNNSPLIGLESASGLDAPRIQKAKSLEGESSTNSSTHYLATPPPFQNPSRQAYDGQLSQSLVQGNESGAKDIIKRLPQPILLSDQATTNPQSSSYASYPAQISHEDIGLPPGAAYAMPRALRMNYSHPPISPSSQAQHWQYQQNNRFSAPLVYPVSLLTPNHSQFISSPSEAVYSTSPQPISDIGLGFGFGSSSPYPSMSGPSQQPQQSQRQPQQLQDPSHELQQRYSLPSSAQGGATSLHLSPPLQPTFPQTTSLRPLPTMAYLSGPGGPGQHLPEMHPSALEARPSASAPFPPTSSPPRKKGGTTAPLGPAGVAGIGTGDHILAPAIIQQRERPDASRPLGQEICLECLMRDRDMADVEATGPGVWSRASDVDFEEALRVEEVAITQAQVSQVTATIAVGVGSSNEERTGLDKRASMSGFNGINGSSSTDENNSRPGPMTSNGQLRYVRSPSRESSLHSGSQSSRGVKRSAPSGIPKRKVRGGHPLTVTSLKLWTSMNQAASSHRYRTIQGFVREQMRYLALERYAQEQSAIEREQADRAMLESSNVRTYFDSRPHSSSGALPSASRQSFDSQSRASSKKGQASQLLPNGMLVETINVAKDEKEAKARSKATSRGRHLSSYAPTEQFGQLAPSNDYYNSTSGPMLGEPASHNDAYSASWLPEQQRRFSSPMLTSKFRNFSSDNLGITRSRNLGDSNSDLRMTIPSSQSSGFRSSSPARQSFTTTSGSPRNSRGWRKSFWNRSASASVLSFAPSGSMMEMHLGISEDKHLPNPPYNSSTRDLNASGGRISGTWPGNASALDESGRISPDESLPAAPNNNGRKKKKGFKKFLNTLIGTPQEVQLGPNHITKSKRAAAEDSGGKARVPLEKRESSLSYAAAYNDDYSEPLAPPPPLSLLTGQQSVRRSFSSSSQSSSSPVFPSSDHPTLQTKMCRPDSLAVPNGASSNGFISPSTSSSDLNRMRPSSATSWRSSLKTGSPQSPREVVAEIYGNTMPNVRQNSMDEIVQPADLGNLRREKSLPALPRFDLEEEFSGDGVPQLIHEMAQLHPQLSRPSIPESSRSASIILSNGQPPVHSPEMMTNCQIYNSGQELDWQYSRGYYEDLEDPSSAAEVIMEQQQGKTKKVKSRSRLFSGFGGGSGKKGQRNSMSPPQQDNAISFSKTDQYAQKSFAPHETALQAVVRDNPVELVSYRYPSVANL